MGIFDWFRRGDSPQMPGSLDTGAPVPPHLLHADGATVEMDLMGALLHMDAAAVFNALTGLGDTNDKGSAARPKIDRLRLNDVELTSLYMNSAISQKIVRTVPTEMTRKGWKLTDGTTDPKVMADEDRRLQTQIRVRDAKTWAQLYGSAIILMVTDEQVDPQFRSQPHLQLAQPLDPGRVNKLLALQVFDALEATPLAFEGDPRKPGYREPLIWNIAPSAVGINSTISPFLRVHASRVLHFRGVPRPPSFRLGGLSLSTASQGNTALDDSVLQATWDEIRNLSQTMAGGAVLAQEIRENILKVGNLSSLATGDQKTEVQNRISLMALSKSLLGIMLLGASDEFQSRHNAPTGFRELSAPAMAMLSAASDIPLSKLFGFAPSGLSTDDKSGRQNFDRKVAGEQEEIRPDLERVYELIFASKEGPTSGQVPDDWALEFLPLDEESEKEIADKRKVVAETDAIYIQNGVLSPPEVTAARFGGDGYQFDLQVAEAGVDVSSMTGEEGAAELAAIEGAPGGEEARDDADPRAGRSVLTAEEKAKAVWLALFPTTPGAIDRIARVREGVEEGLLQGLVDQPVPHLTLLFVGPVEDEEMPDLTEAVTAALADMSGPVDLHPSAVDSFGVGPAGRSPVVLRLYDYQLGQLHDRLLRALAPHVSAPQFLEYKPHITLGAVEGEVDANALAEIDLTKILEGEDGCFRHQPIASVSSVTMNRGGSMVAFFELERRQDQDDLTTGPGGEDGHVHSVAAGATTTGSTDGHTHRILPGQPATAPAGDDDHVHGLPEAARLPAED